MSLIQQIKSLVELHGPSGDEGLIRESLKKLAQPYGDEITVDPLGNLIVHRKGPGARVMLTAHMDTTGWLVTHIEEKGFLRVGPLGGLTAQEAAYGLVSGKNGTLGLLAKEEKAEWGALTWDACYVDLGVTTAQEAKERIQVGDTLVYHSPMVQQGSRLLGPSLDNRISCAILLQVLEGLTECPNDLYVVFTTQEEVGVRGAKTAAWNIHPDWALVVDVTDVDDLPGSQREGTTALGKGAAIKIMDRSVLCHPQMVQELEQLSQVHHIAVQREVMVGGGTEAGVIQSSGLGVCTGGVSVPCRNIHTPTEMVDLEDVKSCIRLLLAYVATPKRREGNCNGNSDQ